MAGLLPAIITDMAEDHIEVDVDLDAETIDVTAVEAAEDHTNVATLVFDVEQAERLIAALTVAVAAVRGAQ